MYRMDILGKLPVEVGLEILQYLNGEDLCRCSVVSKRWRELTNSGDLWRNCCKLEFPQEILDPSVWPKDSLGWKEVYKKCSDCWKWWRQNRHRDVELNGVTWVTPLGNGSLLAAITREGSISLYNLDISNNPIQVIAPYLEEDSEYYWYEMRSSNNILVVHMYLPEESDGIYICYEYIGGELDLWKVIRSSPEEIAFFETVEYSSCVYEIIDETIVLTIEEDYSERSFLQIFSNETWSIETTWTFSWCLHKYDLLVASRHRISSYDLRNGEDRFQISTFMNRASAINIYANDYIILLEDRVGEEECIFTLWSWDLRRIKTSVHVSCTKVLLHPKLSKVFLERKSPGGVSLLIFDLISEQEIWLSKDIPRITPSPSIYSMIYDKFIFCARQSQHEPCIVYDFETGKEMFRIEEREYPTKLVSNKMIILIGGRNNKILLKIFS